MSALLEATLQSLDWEAPQDSSRHRDSILFQPRPGRLEELAPLSISPSERTRSLPVKIWRLDKQGNRLSQS